ncbi:MAG: sulfatase-like hydrolase/transferase [Acidobacteria bacterium]|nr:sulfatase-like hydrolase/transferase [Acidobacteriota bacterium]
MIRHPALIAAARLLSTAFFLATSLYCLLTYNAFAYQQFIRPHLIAALTGFTVWHSVLYWLVLLATAATLVESPSRPPAARVSIFLGASAAAGVWLLAAQVLPQVENSGRSLVLALAALVPPIWLAVLDHRAVRTSPSEHSDGRRLLAGAIVAGLATWATYAAAAPFRPRPSGAMGIALRELILGAASSAIAHLAVFLAIALVALTLRELAAACGWSAGAEYRLLVAASTIAVALLVVRLVFVPIAFDGWAAYAVAAMAGAAVALTWSSVARYRHAASGNRRPTAMDMWFAPLSAARGRSAPIAGLLLLPPAVLLLTRRAAGLDWNFMVQQLIAVTAWVLAFGFAHAALHGVGLRAAAPRGRGAVIPLAVLTLYGADVAAMPRLAGWLGDARLEEDFVLDGYAAVDPSYGLIRAAVTTDPGADPEFYALLRANATIDPRTPISPIDVDVVPPPLAASPAAPPHIFFFLIDSLRPDYVSAYNAAATFTPRLGAFARERGAHVFRRAFSRYGGTGLSVPAIWAGAMVLHKEYVTPFAPMNALEKLLAANGYQWYLTRDHITDLFTPSPAITWLDDAVPEMEHGFCGTMGELEADLRARPPGGPPIFAHTRPLDLHVSKVRSGRAPAGESYPGFSEAYAARVRRIDGCFGRFIDVLKEIGLYENSVVIVTADHGDSLGEEQRWGHAYTLYPEVLRIPLIVRLPPRLDSRMAADLGRAAFSTDITPTLYALLGYRQVARGPLYGAPLFDAPEADWSARRRASFLIGSSYGAVYGALSHNGRTLYIADAINEREYAYDMTSDAVGRRIGLSDQMRARSRGTVRAQLAALAAAYRFTPRP